MTIPSDVMRLPSSGEPRNLSGRVHSISARGTGAGPGVRFVIFLHGCPFRCTSCTDDECKGSNGGRLDTVEKLIDRIAQYADYMRVSGGGVTVAGAEPLEQAQFVRELFRRCHDMGIRTALDTTGIGNLFAARGLLHLTDLVVLDMTTFDATGFDSAALDRQAASPRVRFANLLRQMDKPVWMRFAVIPNQRRSRPCRSPGGVRRILPGCGAGRCDPIPAHGRRRMARALPAAGNADAGAGRCFAGPPDPQCLQKPRASC
jgi:pyruvate formate lyase activating enzyme